MQKRSIDEAAYSRIRNRHPNALDYVNLIKKQVVRSDRGFVLYMLEDPFKYIWYDGGTVLKHYLVIRIIDEAGSQDFNPFMDDSASQFITDSTDIITHSYDTNPITYLYKNIYGRSISRWHMHILVMDNPDKDVGVTNQ